MLDGMKGWLFVYLAGSIPILLFYAAGLSGWVYDYPMWLFIPILAVFAVPLLMLGLKVSSAPTWNIVLVWLGAGLITLRILYAVAIADAAGMERIQALPNLTILVSIIVGAIAWATIWTLYFRRSGRVASTFA